MAFPEAGGTRVPARLPFPQVTARALAYMFIFSVTTMSLLSLKRNPGNFWLMAGNRPELGWQCRYLAVNAPGLRLHLPELRHRRSSSRVPVNPLPHGKFHRCCFPSAPLERGVGAAGAEPHAWVPSCFSPLSSPCPRNHICETGHLLGGAGCLKCRIPSSIPGNHTLRGSSCCQGLRLSSTEGRCLRGAKFPGIEWDGISVDQPGSVSGHHLWHCLPHSGAAANRNPPGNSGNPPQQQPQSVKFRLEALNLIQEKAPVTPPLSCLLEGDIHTLLLIRPGSRFPHLEQNQIKRDLWDPTTASPWYPGGFFQSSCCQKLNPSQGAPVWSPQCSPGSRGFVIPSNIDEAALHGRARNLQRNMHPQGGVGASRIQEGPSGVGASVPRAGMMPDTGKSMSQLFQSSGMPSWGQMDRQKGATMKGSPAIPHS